MKRAQHDAAATRLLLGILSAPDPAALRPCIARAHASNMWERLFDEAVFHEVEAILCRVLAPQAATVPAAVLRALEERHAIQSLRNRALYQELGSILAELQSAEIRTIILKGAYLASCVYQDPALRSMGDIDVLVQPADLLPARDVLQALGYAPDGKAAEHHLPPMRRAGATSVEIHWNIEGPSSPLSIDIAALHRRAVPVRIAGQAAWALSPADLLVHLCLHAAYHHRFGTHTAEGMPLKHLYDIVVLVSRRPAINWAQVRRTADSWRATRYVYTALSVVQRLFAGTIPPRVTAALEHDASDDAIVDLATACLLHRPPADNQPYRKLIRKRGLTKKLRYAGRALRSTPEPSARARARASVRGRLKQVLRMVRQVPRYLSAWIQLVLRTRTGRAAEVREHARSNIEQWIGGR